MFSRENSLSSTKYGWGREFFVCKDDVMEGIFMEKMKMESMDIIQKNIEKLGEIFPGCITEGLDENGKLCKQVNFEVLEELLSKNRGGVKYSGTL